MPELMTFVETNVFTKRIAALGLEESLRGLQLELIDNPEAGDVDPGTGGLRLREIVAQIKATGSPKE